jgi:hypothetical protein
MVRRNKPHSIQHYIRTRVEQLRAEKLKCRDPRDRQWYERLAQELEWCLLYGESFAESKATLKHSEEEES